MLEPSKAFGLLPRSFFHHHGWRLHPDSPRYRAPPFRFHGLDEYRWLSVYPAIAMRDNACLPSCQFRHLLKRANHAPRTTHTVLMFHASIPQSIMHFVLCYLYNQSGCDPLQFLPLALFNKCACLSKLFKKCPSNFDGLVRFW